MNNSDARAKLQILLKAIGDETPAVINAKRSIFSLFKEMKEPEKVIITTLDTSETNRLQKEVHHLQSRINGLLSEFRYWKQQVGNRDEVERRSQHLVAWLSYLKAAENGASIDWAVHDWVKMAIEDDMEEDEIASTFVEGLRLFDDAELSKSAIAVLKASQEEV